MEVHSAVRRVISLSIVDDRVLLTYPIARIAIGLAGSSTCLPG